MKHLLYIIVSAAILLTACVNEQDDIFPDSATERLDKVIREGKSALTTSEKGWIMQYFPDDEKDGFTLLLKFVNPDKVTVACQNYVVGDIYYERSSFFDVVGDDGAVLTFNTYNEIFHLFSDPYIAGLPIGLGLGGDYEFRIRKVTDSELVMKGKKNGATILMTEFTENMSWEAYLNELLMLDQSMFSVAGPPLVLTINDKTYTVTGGYDHVFEIYPNNAGENAVPVYAPFIVTKTGIRFSTPIVLNGQELMSFNLNDDKSALISTDNSSVTIKGPKLNNFLNISTVLWNFNESTISPALQENYSKLENALKSKYGASKVEFAFRSRGSFLSLNIVLTVAKNKLIGNVNLDMTMKNDDQLSLNYTGNVDTNGAIFYNNVDELRQFVEKLSGDIKLTTTSSFNPVTMKMENINNNDVWISIAY